MDLPRLRELFSQYLQSLFSMGYLKRSPFRQFYVTTMASHGFTSEYMHFRSSSDSMLLAMERAMAAPKPDFPTVVTIAERLLESTTSIGALRTRNLIELVISYARIEHKQGCLSYLKMLVLEFMSLMYCFSIIAKMEASVAQLGGEVPLDW